MHWCFCGACTLSVSLHILLVECRARLPPWPLCQTLLRRQRLLRRTIGQRVENRSVLCAAVCAIRAFFSLERLNYHSLWPVVADMPSGERERERDRERETETERQRERQTFRQLSQMPSGLCRRAPSPLFRKQLLTPWLRERDERQREGGRERERERECVCVCVCVTCTAAAALL